MGEPVKKDDKIPLSLQLSDEDVTAHVQVELTDAVKVPLGASPVTLTHDVDGHFVDNSVDMPATDRVFVFYRVFTDAALLNRHPLHRDTLEDIFERDIIGEKVENLNIDDFNKLLSGVQGEFSATVESDDLNASVEEATLNASIDTSELTATIEDDELVGTSESNDINANLECD